MNSNQFKSFSPKALFIATLSVASLASCTKDEISQDLSSNEPKQEINIEGKATGQYMVILKDGNQVNNGLSVGKQLDMVRDAAKQLLLENGMQGVAINIENTLSNGFTTKLTAEQIIALKSDSRVAYIEEDRLVNPAQSDKTSSTINTIQVTSWGVTKVGGSGDGTGKTAWIIDSGIDTSHKDLIVDKLRSKSFLLSSQGTDYLSFNDAYGHGTQVAGIIGAQNNSFGTVGVAAGATLVALRVMDANGSAYVSKIVAALNHVALNGTAGDVVNLSIGLAPSTAVDDAVKKVAAKGIYVAIASGNNGGDAGLKSPARVNATNVFTVSSMSITGIFSSNSNYGATTVDYAAPGVNVYTTAKGGKYSLFNGTSAAAPHMAGILLMNAGSPNYNGYVSGDKDAMADKIASK